MVDFSLYLITDRHATRLPLLKALKTALEAGVGAVQLREKDLPIRSILSLAGEVRALTSEFGARLFINDRVDAAVAVDADGVHLGREGMPPHAAKKIVGGRMLIGVSTHSLAEAVEAETDGADFITFGPVFATPSKMKYGPPKGLNALAEVKRLVSIPVFGLGGISARNIRAVLDAGADGVGMISAILSAEDIRSAVEEIKQALAR